MDRSFFGRIRLPGQARERARVGLEGSAGAAESNATDNRPTAGFCHLSEDVVGRLGLRAGQTRPGWQARVG